MFILNDEIMIKVFDHDVGEKDDFLGECFVYGRELLSGEKIKKIFNEAKGSTLEITYESVELDKLVTFDVTAKNIPKTDNIGHCDPYVLIFDARTKTMIYRTQIKKNCKEATWPQITIDRYQHPKLKFVLKDYDGNVAKLFGDDDIVSTTRTNFDLESLDSEATLDMDCEQLEMTVTISPDCNTACGSHMHLMSVSSNPQNDYGEIKFCINVTASRSGMHGTVSSIQQVGKIAQVKGFVDKAKDTVKKYSEYSHKKMIITDVALILIEHLDNRPSTVMCIDRHFTVKKSSTVTKAITIETMQVKKRIRIKDSKKLEEVFKFLSVKAANNLDKYRQSRQSRPKLAIEETSAYGFWRDRQLTRWFMGGRDYFAYLASVLKDAKKEVFITDWYISPKVMLLRKPIDQEKHKSHYQLDQILLELANRGVNIYIQIFGPPDMAGLQIANNEAEKYFNGLHENIQLMQHMSGVEDIKMWSHHEKVVVVDQSVAFVGGIDLCSGRWDDESYQLWDQTKPYKWPGKDYRNKFRFSQGDTPTDTWDDDYDPEMRINHNRCPWEDIAGVVYGSAAYDVGVHFIQRWNFTKAQTSGQDVLSRSTAAFRPLIPKEHLHWQAASFHNQKSHGVEPERERQFLTPVGENRFNRLYKANVHCLRSSGEWSLGLRETDNSIYQAYLRIIQNAKEYIYIENQFFVSTCDQNPDVFNHLAMAICNKVIDMHQMKRDFKVYIVIPHVPEFEFNGLNCRNDNWGAKIVMHWQCE